MVDIDAAPTDSARSYDGCSRRESGSRSLPA